MFRPESPRSSVGKPNFMLGWIASVDSDISIIDLLGVDCRKRREKESKQNRTNPVHKIPPAASINYALSGYQLDAISHCSIPHRLYLAYRLVYGPRPRQLRLGIVGGFLATYRWNTSLFRPWMILSDILACIRHVAALRHHRIPRKLNFFKFSKGSISLRDIT